MGIKTVKSGPAKGKVNPIQKRTPVGVMEDGYDKQLKFREKKRPHSTPSAETGNPNGKSFGTKVQ